MQTDKKELEQVIEGILFVSGQGVEIADIAEKLEIEKKEVEKAIENLKEKHKDDGINIITYKTSVQMCSNPIYADDIATVLNPIREKQLTKAALETAAIIAYKQPITKTEIPKRIIFFFLCLTIESLYFLIIRLIPKIPNKSSTANDLVK